MRHGFLLIAKPVGPTSHDVVDTVRERLGERKIGHLGTLDPAAEGLLVLAVGAKALKVVELFNNLPKEYEAELTFGAVSSTYDREGVIERVPPKPGWTVPTAHDLQRIIADRFLGKVQQVPPAASSVKVGGERAYRRMRRAMYRASSGAWQGRSVDLPSRSVEISECRVLAYEFPRVTLRVACSSGTYVRSLAHDLGSSLRCGGYLSQLKRTRVGEWMLEQATEPERVAWAHVLPLKDVLADRPRLHLTDAEAEKIRFGQVIEHDVKPSTIAWHEGLPIAILIPAKEGLVGCRARKVF